MSSAGDVNGDGFDDLLIGAYNADAAGEMPTSFLAGRRCRPRSIWGRWAAPDSPFTASIPTTLAVRSVSSAGDVNGDGFDDLLIGAYNADAAGNAKIFAGESYVIFGGPALPTTIDLGALGSAGLTLYGVDTDDFSGSSVSSAGDVNGDGFDDLLIGAEYADASGNAKKGAGESYVIFGGPALPATIDLGALGSAGLTLYGADAYDRSGSSVSSAGDVNGDGFDDLLIGAEYADAAGNAKNRAGDSYVVFGADFSSSVTHPGTAAAETLMGSLAADVMIGGRGDDTLLGNGGPDVLRGGEGDDVLAVGDLNFHRVVGGNGTDTLRLDTAGAVLDLTTVSANRIFGVEEIDITGSGGNALVLDRLAVLNVSNESNALTVVHDNDDIVDIGNGWIVAGTEMIDGQPFEVLTQGTATLKLPGGIDFADAPTTAVSGFAANYPTLQGDDDGAGHRPVGPQLGTLRDGELDGIPSATAQGDDADGADDEDGISNFGPLVASITTPTLAPVDVDLQNPDPISNRLDAWVDWNRDGDWDDDSEPIFVNFNLGTVVGVQTLGFIIPRDQGANVQAGNTFARFRVSTAGGLTPRGLAVDGEVEDYQVTIASASSGPRVTNVLVGNASWSADYKARIPGADPDGYRIPHGADQTKTLHWGNVREVFVEFDRPVEGFRSWRCAGSR